MATVEELQARIAELEAEVDAQKSALKHAHARWDLYQSRAADLAEKLSSANARVEALQANKESKLVESLKQAQCNIWDTDDGGVEVRLPNNMGTFKLPAPQWFVHLEGHG